MTNEVILVASTRRRVAAVLLLGFPALYAYSAYEGAASDRAEQLTLAALATVAFTYLAVILWRTRFRYDDHGIERLTPLTKRMHVSWRDVTSIRGGPFLSLVLSGRFPKPLTVPSALVGTEALQRFILTNLRDALSDYTRGLLERRFGSASAIAVPIDAPEPSPPDAQDRTARWRENPFFVLGLSPECSRADVERTGQKLLALLAIDSGPAKRASTPLGEVVRTVDTVRAAMAELRDPERRLSHETWARLDRTSTMLAARDDGDESEAPWIGAKAAIGMRAA